MNDLILTSNLSLIAAAFAAGLLLGVLGFFCSDRNARFRSVLKQTAGLCGVAGLAAAVLLLLALDSGGSLALADFMTSLALGGFVSIVAGVSTLGVGRHLYLTLFPVEPDSRLRPPRKI